MESPRRDGREAVFSYQVRPSADGLALESPVFARLALTGILSKN